MAAPTKLPLIVFDLGGVLVRICRSIQEAGQRIGLHVPDEDIVPERRAERRAVHAEYELGKITCDEFFSRISATTHGKYSADQFRAMHDAWLIDEYPLTRELIHALHTQGLATGVLSNTNASHWAALQGQAGRAAGSILNAGKFLAPSMPTHRFASHLMGLAKPDRAMFDEFARTVRRTPSEIVFFDDLQANVLGARAAGWTAHQIDHAASPAHQMSQILREFHGINIPLPGIS